MTTTGDVLLEISSLPSGATALDHLLSARSRVKTSGCVLKSTIITKESINKRSLLRSSLITTDSSNKTLKTRTSIQGLRTNIKC